MGEFQHRLVEFHYRDSKKASRRFAVDPLAVMAVLEDDIGSAVIYFSTPEVGTDTDDKKVTIGGNVWRRLVETYEEVLEALNAG